MGPLLVCSVLCAAPAAAPASRGGVAAGATASLNIARLTGRDVPDNLGSTVRWALGAFVRVPVTDGVWFEPGLVYDQKGAAGEIAGSEIAVTLDYAELPLLFVFGLPAANTVDVRVVLGPCLGWNIIATGTTAAGEEESLRAKTRAFELSLIAGAGLDVTIGGGPRLVVDLRYGFGLTSIDATSSEGDVRNRVLALTAGVGI
jgi:hypothetical protein